MVDGNIHYNVMQSEQREHPVSSVKLSSNQENHCSTVISVKNELFMIKQWLHVSLLTQKKGNRIRFLHLKERQTSKG